MNLPPLIAVAALSTVLAALSRVAVHWLDARFRLLQMRELSRCDHVRNLPAGSRVVDLGASAIVIQVGETGCG
jgi:hypothetical protein